jgi:SET domain-containing protein
MSHELVETRPSCITGAGLGVFAKRNIGKNTVLFSYKGVGCLTNVSLKHDREYRFEVAGTSYSVTLDDMGGMINDTVDFRPLTPAESVALFNGMAPKVMREYNCQFTLDGTELTIKAICDICAGDELYIDYGVNYWVPRYLKARYVTSIASFTPNLKN